MSLILDDDAQLEADGIGVRFQNAHRARRQYRSNCAAARLVRIGSGTIDLALPAALSALSVVITQSANAPRS